MEFRLVLRGVLPPDKRGTVDAKHAIRREIHPQLKALWQQHPRLKGSLALLPWGHDPTPRARVDIMADRFSRCGFRFVPLIREESQMACSLDILVLRRSEPHRVFTGAGDLDNRVKTLIDALRIPSQCSEVTGQHPSPDEDPMYCLLEDDKLVYDFRVTSDRLLVPPASDETVRDMVAVVAVTVRSASGGMLGVSDGSF